MRKLKSIIYNLKLILCFTLAVNFMLFAGDIKEKYKIPRTIKYGYTLTNQTNKVLEKVEFYTYAPVKQTATQMCREIKSSYPYTLIEDEYKNQILKFTFEKFPPYAVKIINIKAALLLSEEPLAYSVKNSPEEIINEKDITELAEKLNRKDNEITAKNIFEWVSENIKYEGFVQEDKGALYALRNKKGDCTEYMNLFIALCSADKIPSRGIGGYVCEDNKILKPFEYHNWAEFLDKGVWKLSDPQKKVFMTKSVNYIAMQILKESQNNPLGKYKRFLLNGEGAVAVMNKNI